MAANQHKRKNSTFYRSHRTRLEFMLRGSSSKVYDLDSKKNIYHICWEGYVRIRYDDGKFLKKLDPFNFLIRVLLSLFIRLLNNTFIIK